jgi:hypothetical protein
VLGVKSSMVISKMMHRRAPIFAQYIIDGITDQNVSLDGSARSLILIIHLVGPLAV